MRFGVVIFPGSNCDHDCHDVIRNVLKQPVEYIWHGDTSLDHLDCLVLPGGFSYGDYLRCGAIARFSPVMEAIIKYSQRGGRVIGICNGFQILTEAGLLPGALVRNKNLHFICKHVKIRTENAKTPFTGQLKNGQLLNVPIAHGEGNYSCDGKLLKELKRNKQIVFTYYGDNPNGSVANIAGICNKRHNVLGMMPHPERASEDILGSSDGLAIFQSILRHPQ